MKIYLKIIPVIICLLFFTSCENEEVELPTVNAVDVIPQDSELYKQLQNISENEESTETEEGSDDEKRAIECIDFIYPITIYVLNENLVIVRSKVITGDEKFSSFLSNVETDYSISVSFPISAKLENGDTFLIETIKDLKGSIDNCVKEEKEIAECEGIIEKCIWEVGYLEEQDNKYLGATIQETNGQILLTNNANNYIGTWTPFILNDELHLNIYFQDANNTGVSSHFNYDWKVIYMDADRVVLQYEDKMLLINNRCDDDYANCTNFQFEECEQAEKPGVATFVLDNYTACILDILRLNEGTKVSYFTTYENAENEESELPSDQDFITSSASQVIYAKVANADGSSSLIIEVTLTAKGC